MDNRLRGATITPAYGRDYNSAAEARQAFVSGTHAFYLASMTDAEGSFVVPPRSNISCTVSSFVAGARVSIRFCRLTRQVVVQVPAS